MYQVYMSLNGVGGKYELVHDPTGDDEELILVNGKVNQSVDQIDSFTFDVYPNFKYWAQFRRGTLSGEENAPSLAFNIWFQVKDVETDTIEFEGRIISMTPSMDSDGMMFVSVVCEGAEALLLDVAIDNREILIPGQHMYLNGEDLGPIVLMEDNTYRVKPEWYFRQLLEEYNKHAGASNQMVIGGYENPTGTMVYRRASYYYARQTYGTVVYDEIQSLLESERTHTKDNSFWISGKNIRDQYVDLVVKRNSAGRLYCFIDDYSNNIPSTTGDGFDIKLSSNMLSVKFESDYTDVVSVIEPLGQEYSTEKEYTIDDFNFGTDDSYVDIERGTFTYDKPERIPLSKYLHYDGLEEGNPGFESLFYPLRENSDFRVDGNYTQIVNMPATQKYGIIRRPLIIDNYAHSREDKDGNTEYYVTRNDAFNFLTRCLDYLVQHSRPKESISVNAADLSLLPNYPGFARFKLRQWYGVKNPLLDFSAYYPLVRRTINIDHPEDSEIELANKAPRETDYSYVSSKKQKMKEAELGTADKDSGSIGQDNYALAGVSRNTTPVESGKEYISDYVIWTSATTGSYNKYVDDFHVKYLVANTITWFKIFIKVKDIAEALGFDASDYEYGDTYRLGIDGTETGYFATSQYIKGLPFSVVGVNVMNALARRESTDSVDQAWTNNVIMASPPEWGVEGIVYGDENGVNHDEPVLSIVFGVKNTFKPGESGIINIYYAPFVRLHILREKRPGEGNISFGPFSSYRNGNVLTYKTRRILIWGSNVEPDYARPGFGNGWSPVTLKLGEHDT